MDDMLETIKLLMEVFGCAVGMCENIKQFKYDYSKGIISRIAKEYRALPEASYDEDENVIKVMDNGKQIATYFDIGNGRILISGGSTIVNNDSSNISTERKKLLSKHKEKINNNILISDILVDNERQAKIILGIWKTT